MTVLKPLVPYEIRDINREIQECLSKLTPMKELVVVKSFKKRKCYSIGYNTQDLILRNFVRMMQSHFKPYPLTPTTVALTDTSGTSRNIAYGDYSVPFPFRTLPASGGTKLQFGDPATTPTPARTDYALASLVASINPSATTIDETNWRVIVTGSYVWTSGGTVRETGLVLTGVSTDGNFYDFLIYHDAVSDVVVPAGGTVSVTYTTQF